MGCSPACMRLLSKKFGYLYLSAKLDTDIPWILDELSLNAVEKDRMAETFIALMSSQFIATTHDLRLPVSFRPSWHIRTRRSQGPHVIGSGDEYRYS